MTFSAWRTLVKAAYQGGEPTHAALIRTVVDGARFITVRDVESDLALSKSYLNTFLTQQVKLAGTRITESVSDIITEAKTLMPIDDDTAAISAILDNAITFAYDSINGMADKWDAHLLQAAIDLQRHVPFYQVRQTTTYVKDTVGVTTEGFISKVALPDTARIQQLWFGHYYAPLEADFEYAVDDVVLSNARAYKVVTGGTLTVYDIGNGLTSTDGTDETLGDLVFKYFRPERDWPVRQMEWPARNRLLAGDFSGGPAYAFPPESDVIWLYPALDDKHRFDLEWVGVAEDFGDTDSVLFDKTAAEAAAHYIRFLLYTTELDDPKNGAISMALYQKALRKAVLDNQERDTGSSTQVAPYDYRRRCRFWGSCFSLFNINSNNQTIVNPNAWYPVANTGGDSTLTSTAPNQSFALTFSGGAGLSRVVLSTQGRSAGDTMNISVNFSNTPGIIIDFRNGSLAGDTLLPAESFPDLTYTTDGLTTRGLFTFVFGNNEWLYDQSKIPA